MSSNLNQWIAEGEAALTAGVSVYDAATGKSQQTTAAGGTASGTSANPAGTSTASSGLPSFMTSKTTEYIVIAVGAAAALAVIWLMVKK